MRLFDDIIGELERLIGVKADQGRVKALPYLPGASWPASDDGNIILQSEVGVELGNPRDASVSFTAWTGTPSLVRGDTLSVVGPDLADTAEKRLPFGKVVLVEGTGFSLYRCHEEDDRGDGPRLRQLRLSKRVQRGG